MEPTTTCRNSSSNATSLDAIVGNKDRRCTFGRSIRLPRFIVIDTAAAGGGGGDDGDICNIRRTGGFIWLYL